MRKLKIFFGAEEEHNVESQLEENLNRLERFFSNEKRSPISIVPVGKSHDLVVIYFEYDEEEESDA